MRAKSRRYSKIRRAVTPKSLRFQSNSGRESFRSYILLINFLYYSSLRFHFIYRTVHLKYIQNLAQDLQYFTYKCCRLQVHKSGSCTIRIFTYDGFQCSPLLQYKLGGEVQVQSSSVLKLNKSLMVRFSRLTMNLIKETCSTRNRMCILLESMEDSRVVYSRG